MLNYEGDVTESLVSDISATSLQSSLNSLPSISQVGFVNVTLEVENSTERGYRVKFVFDQPESTFMLQDESQMRGQFVTVLVNKAGMSSAKGFSISLGGKKSTPIHPSNSQEEIAQVVENLFTAQCRFSANMGELLTGRTMSRVH